MNSSLRTSQEYTLSSTSGFSTQKNMQKNVSKKKKKPTQKRTTPAHDDDSVGSDIEDSQFETQAYSLLSFKPKYKPAIFLVRQMEAYTARPRHCYFAC